MTPVIKGPTGVQKGVENDKRTLQHDLRDDDHPVPRCARMCVTRRRSTHRPEAGDAVKVVAKLCLRSKVCHLEKIYFDARTGPESRKDRDEPFPRECATLPRSLVAFCFHPAQIVNKMGLWLGTYRR